jgi:IS4 transposase
LADTITTATGLQYIDEIVGEGAEAKGGETAIVHYTGWLYNNREKGKKFDSSVDRREPFKFPLGGGRVIAGWDPRVSGLDFVDIVHGIDSTCFQAFGDVPGHEKEIDTMQHQNSVFHELLKHVPWSEFDRLVDDHGSDARIRRLTTKSQLVALLYGQFSGASSLREITTGLESHQDRLYHLGARVPRRSTFADANALRPVAVFSELLSAMMKQAHRGLRRALADTTYLIDSTGLRLNGLSAGWARFSAGVCGTKLHIIYDADADRPIYAAVTAARVNDITAAQAMPITPGATYVFDLGYYDYGWWAKMDAAGCRIVTRFKANTPLDCREELPLTDGGDILSDRIGFLPTRQARSRRNPMGDAVREVRVATDTGKVLRILSNDLDASAREIADLYKRRWAIELFFRWVKQTLKITRFLGTSQNAVGIQIAVALIAFLILRLAQATQNAVRSTIAFARLVRANLMHRRRIDRLLQPIPRSLEKSQQMALNWT